MIYCDRTGARVSDEFDWTDTHSFLHTFVWKLAHLSAEQLGFDPTAEFAMDEECAGLQTARGHGTLPQHVVEAVNNAFDDHWPVYRLRITIREPFPDEVFPAQNPVTLPASSQPATLPAQPTRKDHYFPVARPYFHTDALVGRCMKCYIVYDLDGRRFCFLKDYWRPLVTNRARPEHLVYNRLHSARTPFIATLICGGDVGGPRGQITKVQDNLPSKNRPVPRVHYRIAIAEIGRPLKMFNGFRHLANIFAQAITAHDHAVKYAGVLHRDISVGNIMINSAGVGILIDWDYSLFIPSLLQALLSRNTRVHDNSNLPSPFDGHGNRIAPQTTLSRSSTLSGTWFSDTTLPRLSTSTHLSRTTSTITSPSPAVFDDGVRLVKRGGDDKLLHFRVPKSGLSVTGSPKLQALLDNIARRCYESYAAIDEGRMDSLYGLPEHTPDNQQEEQRSAPPPVQSLNLSWITRSRSNGRPPAVSPSATSTPAPPADPCDISGFLADAREVVKVLLVYIHATSSQADQEADARSKAADEFRRRASECPKINLLSRLQNQHISALSTRTSSTLETESASSASAFGPVLALDNNLDQGRSSSPWALSSGPSRDPSSHPSAPQSRATSPEFSVAPSSNEPPRQGSPLPGVPPIAGPFSEGEVPLEILGKRRGRTSDVVEAVSRMASGATAASTALPKPPKKARN